MKISYALGHRSQRGDDTDGLPLSFLFQEPLVSAWSKYGTGQLCLVDPESEVTLAVDYLGSDRYFLDWHYDGRMVVYDGGSCAEFVTTDMGGDPFRIPLACLVTSAIAIRALEYTAKHKARDPALNWVCMDDVPFLKKWYDD